MRANLLVVDLDHPSLWPATDPLRSLTLSEVSPAIVGMMVNGSWRGALGDFQRSILDSDNHREAVTEAKGRLNALLNRAGLA
jgi:hypothetical protein